MAAVLQQTHLQARFPDVEMNAKVDLTRDVDPHGTSLSGGEAQRVAIARALYRDAPILVLDEPTAALDPVAEAEVFAQFDAMSRQKTVLLVSHRMSATLMSQDIVIFAKGGIVDEGTHQDLYQRSALYRKMYDAQAQYYVQQ
jgi:ABC-type multidrug transport system fused ATPase/permease subunit